MSPSILRGLRSQVGIFILVAVVAIFLLGFIIFQSLNEREDEVDGSQDVSKSDGPQELLPVKQQVDFCLGKQVRRAAIIAGIRGGYIYDQGEYYFAAAIPDETYSDEYITNMDLNWNNLLFSTLVHYHADAYSPNINQPLSITYQGQTEEIYNRGIKYDFERFIREQFLECMRMERYEERGLNVTYENYVGSISSVSPDHESIKVIDMEAEPGDNVSFGLKDTLIHGYVDSMVGSSMANVAITNPGAMETIAIEEIIGTTEVLNMNATTTVNVTFSDESISASMNFPLRLQQGNQTVAFDSTQVSIPVRFKKLLEISEILLHQKYRNRSLDYSNPAHVEQALQGNRYMENTDLPPFKVVKSVYNNSKEYKRYVYSFVDEASRIQGNPYVFNFGYENRAPRVNTSALSPMGTEADGSLLYVLSKDAPFRTNLSPHTGDQQIKDNYFSYFEPFTYDGPDGTFRINREGEVYFEATQRKRYEFDVAVTDRGTQRSYSFTFLTSFPPNEDNEDAEGCFAFQNKDVSTLYPINDAYDNKLFTTTQGGKEHAYGFYLYSDDSNVQSVLERPVVRLRQSCYMSLDSYDLDVTVTSGGTEISPHQVDGAEITLPLRSQPMTVSVDVIEPNSGTAVLQEPFKVTLYPAACLGPGDPPSSASNSDLRTNCCNVGALQNAISNGNPENFYANSNLQSGGGTAKTIPSYFCYDMAQIATNPDLRAYEEMVQQEILWDKYGMGADTTSLYEGNVQVVCDGTSAIGNVDRVSATGSVDFSRNAPYVLRRGIPYPNPIPVQLTEVQQGGVCNFCALGHAADFQLLFGSDTSDLANNFMLQGGPKSLNVLQSNGGETGMGPQPNMLGSERVGDLPIKCSDDFFGRITGGSWTTGQVGYNANPSTIEVSDGGYCQIGSVACAGRSITATTRSDQPDACVDYYHSSDKDTGIVSPGDPEGWGCGTCYYQDKYSYECETDGKASTTETCYGCEQKQAVMECSGPGACNRCRKSDHPYCS